MMRILVLDQYGEIGGAQRCLLDAVAGFRKHEWEVHAGVPEGDLFNRLGPLCNRIAPIPSGPFRAARKTALDCVRFLAQMPAQVRTIRGLLRAAHFDAVYVNGPRLMPAAAIAHGSTPVIFHAHNVVAGRGASKAVHKALCYSGAAVIASSKFVAQSLVGTGGAIRVIPNGVPPCAVPRNARNGTLTVAVLGRIAPEKGQLGFVRAAAIARVLFANARFVVAGAPMFADRAYFEQVRDAAEHAGVELTGWIANPNVFLSSIDLLVVPSGPIDATPRVILEAHAALVPVLAFACGGIPELIEDGETGILVREHSPEALARAIAAAVSNRSELARMAARALDRWRREFTLARFQENVCAAIQETVERRHHRKPLARAGAMVEA
jgi:glycosyltransferase involved in cell wall biosynthesis